jgi:hypothetical protein
MGFFDKLFKRTNVMPSEEKPKTSPKESKPAVHDPPFPPLAKYIPASSAEVELVSVIATSLAAGDASHSQFVVKKVVKRNPEFLLVSLIATSIAAADHPSSTFIVKNIYTQN